MREGDYRGRIRVRVCGLLIRDGALLLAQIHSPVTNKLIWTPPGGGLEFGESIEQCLLREFHEETGLKVTMGPFHFLHELVEEPFHAVELYYRVHQAGGSLNLGRDPEHGPDGQLLKDIRFVPFEDFGKYHIVPANLKSRLNLK